MTLETGVKELAEAVGADVKALANDPRLTDSREWTATTVPQAEAEAGTASARRAWTAQRVRQAINAWWQDALNNNIIGVGQTWQDVTASRVRGTTYTNTTGKPIAVSVTAGVNNTRTLSLYVNDVLVGSTLLLSSVAMVNQLFAIVPSGSTYKATLTGGTSTINSWVELR